MKQSFLAEVAEKKLFASADKILLAISGGVDSMVMLHLFIECKFNVGVAHANFQLRGNESEADEKFIRDVCEKKSIPFFSKKFETEHYAKANHVSIQMAARALRYQWFNELLTENHFDFVATAHHLNDSIETVLLNFVRGSGLKGLDGIASKNEKTIRPMLFATRQQIEDFARENKIEWREDSSNTTDDYTRNFIRHHIYPKLKELNPSLENSFDDSLMKIAGSVELMELGLEQWRVKFESKNGNQILLDKKGFELFNARESVLWNLIKGYGFNLSQCVQIITALHGQPGKRFSSAQFELVIDRNDLIISRILTDEPATWVKPNQTEAVLGNISMKFERKEKVAVKNDSSFAFLDADKIAFPLCWRKWKSGDYFHPLGMDHKKKLSDFLIDQKISISDKETVTVLESANEIVWVVGLRIDEGYKVTESTKSTLVCHLMTLV